RLNSRGGRTHGDVLHAGMETHQNDECLLQEAVSRGGPWRAGAWRRSPDRDGSNGARALRTDGSQLRGRYQVPMERAQVTLARLIREMIADEPRTRAGFELSSVIYP